MSERKLRVTKDMNSGEKLVHSICKFQAVKIAMRNLLLIVLVFLFLSCGVENEIEDKAGILTFDIPTTKRPCPQGYVLTGNSRCMKKI